MTHQSCREERDLPGRGGTSLGWGPGTTRLPRAPGLGHAAGQTPAVSQEYSADGSEGAFSSFNAPQQEQSLLALLSPSRHPPRTGCEALASNPSKIPNRPCPRQRAASRATSACTCPLFSSPGLSHPFSIDIFEDYIYGVTYINNRIFKIHKFGHKAVTNLTSGLNHATDVVLYHQYKQPEGVCWAQDPCAGPRTPALLPWWEGGARSLMGGVGG